MTKIIVLGYYGFHNMGDDLLESSIRNMFIGQDLTFSSPDRIDNISSYQVVIVGGGDLFNDYFSHSILRLLSKFDGYKIALGVGVSYEQIINNKFIHVFDDILIRNRTDLIPISRIIGSKNTHFVPDLVFSLPLSPYLPDKNKNRVGVFPIGSLLKTPSMMFSLLTLLNKIISLGYKLDLIPMDYNPDSTDYDIPIIDYIYKVFHHTKAVTKYGQLSQEEFISNVSHCNYAICFRFHSHVMATRFNIPFISFPITRKNKNFYNELELGECYNIDINRSIDFIPSCFDPDQALEVFQKLIENQEEIKARLSWKNKEFTDFYQNNKIVHLVSNHSKRHVPINPINKIDREEIYNKYKRQLTPDKNKEEIFSIADSLCYDLTHDPANDYAYGTRGNLLNNPNELWNIIDWIYKDFMENIKHNKFNLNYIKQDSFKGLHRAGWQYAIDSLYSISDDYGIFLDTYLDRTFGWASQVLHKDGILPYSNYWVGFLHHTFDTYFSDNNCERVFSSPLFIASLPFCKGIFCLTNYLARQVKERLYKLGYNIPVNVLMHPTVFPANKFSYQKYMDNSNKRLINIGSWYRNPIMINRINPVDGIIYTSLKGKRMDSNFCPDCFDIKINDGKIICDNNIWSKYYFNYINSQSDQYSKEIYNKIIQNGPGNIKATDLVTDFVNRVEVISTLSNNDYDELLTKNIVFLYLIDASVANTIIECIVRKTPLVVNKIEPVVELLGEEYPLLYEKIEDIPDLLRPEKIKSAYEYLLKYNDESIRIESFVEQVITSEIYNFI